MPLPKRAIVPVNVSSVLVPKGIDNELEYVANATLSNLTRQLASLCLQASDIFTELTEQLIGITNRSERLDQRIESVSYTLSQMTIREDDLMIGLMSLQTNPYRSRMEADQQVLNKNSMPNAILDVYQDCEPPPALDQLDKYRYDSKQSMKFYSDPTFFFHLWCQEMLQETKQKKKKKRRRPKKQATAIPKFEMTQPIKPTIPTEQQNNKVVNGSCVNNVLPSESNNSFNGFELPPPLLPPMDSRTVNLPQPQFNYEDVSIYNTISPQKIDEALSNVNCNNPQKYENESKDDTSNICPPPPSMSYLSHKPGAHPMSSNIHINSNIQHECNSSIPVAEMSFRGGGPPTALPIAVNQDHPNKFPNAGEIVRDNRIPAPPAPPSPPPPPSVPPPPKAPPSLSNSNNSKPVPVQSDYAPPLDLLTAIRNGIQLRKVGETDNRPVPISEAVSKAERKFDVQAIFEEVYKRRPFVDNSDTDDGSDEDEDSSLWSSDNDK